MLNPVKEHFRRQIIKRIILLTRPGLARRRGCLYVFIKLLLVGLVCQFAGFLAGVTTAALGLIGLGFEFLSGAVDIVSFAAMFVLIIYAIDSLEDVWQERALEDFKEDGDIVVADILHEFVNKGWAANPSDEHILQNLSDKGGALNGQLWNLSYEEAALTQDAFLYVYEVKGVPSPFSYGTQVIFVTTIVLLVMAMSSTFKFLTPYLTDFFGPYQAGMGPLFVVILIGVGVVAFVLNDIDKLWKACRPFGRNTLRSLLYYWPATLFAVIMLSGFMKVV